MSTNNVESIPSSECIHILNSLDNIVFGLEESNISDSIESTIKLINLFFPYSFNYALSRILLISFISQRKDFKVYIDYIKSIEAKEEEFQIDASNRLINVFTNYLIPKQTQESFYIIEQLIKNHLVEPDVTNKIQSFYFVHRKQNLGKPVRATSYIEEDFVNGYDDLSKNDWELHKKYIEEGHAPNELARVIRNDDIEKFQEIVTQSNFDLNQFIKPSLYERYSFINQSKVPLIDYAAYFGAVKCFKYLLANGAKLQSIKYAIAGGNIEIIHLCEQNHTSFKDATETALEFHQNEIVNYISDNQLETITNLTYLGLKCIQYDNYEYLSILENENMEINNMIINESARTGNALLVMHFIEGKEIPKNFMFFSIESLNVEFMKFILNQKGFDVNMRDNLGRTPLILSVKNNSIEMVQYILQKKGYNINDKDNSGSTALICAVCNNNIEITKLLLEEKGIDINAKDKNGNTPFIHAAESGNIEIVKLLLEKGVIDVNATNNYGDTALMLSSAFGKPKVVKLLLQQKGININAKNSRGETALIEATISHNPKVFKLLLDHEGIDVNAKDKEGNTAIMILRKPPYYSPELIQMLLEHGAIDSDRNEGNEGNNCNIW